jgi:hypothetical protein
MSPVAQNDIKMHFYDFYQINLYVFNKFQIYFINYSGFLVEIGVHQKYPLLGDCKRNVNYETRMKNSG